MWTLAQLEKKAARLDERIEAYLARLDEADAGADAPEGAAAARRWIGRHRHQATLDALEQRMRGRPEAMDVRRCLAEHPFGIIKAMMGAPRFLCRGLKAVAAEMALSVTA